MGGWAPPKPPSHLSAFHFSSLGPLNLSFQEVIFLGTHLSRKSSFWELIFLGSHLSGNSSFQELIFLGTHLSRKSSFWEPIFLGSHLSGNPSFQEPIFLGTHLSRNPSFWEPIFLGTFLSRNPSFLEPIFLGTHLSRNLFQASSFQEIISILGVATHLSGNPSFQEQPKNLDFMRNLLWNISLLLSDIFKSGYLYYQCFH